MGFLLIHLAQPKLRASIREQMAHSLGAARPRPLRTDCAGDPGEDCAGDTGKDSAASTGVGGGGDSSSCETSYCLSSKSSFACVLELNPSLLSVADLRFGSSWFK